MNQNKFLFLFFLFFLLFSPGIVFADVIIFPALLPTYFLLSIPLLIIPLSFLFLFLVSLIETVVFIKWIFHRCQTSPNFLKSLLFIILANIASSIAGIIITFIFYLGFDFFLDISGFFSPDMHFFADSSSRLLAQITSSIPINNPLGPSSSSSFSFSLLRDVSYVIIAAFSGISSFFMFFIPIKNFNFMSFFGRGKNLIASLISLFFLLFFSLASFPLVGLLLIAGPAWFFSSLIEMPFFSKLAQKYLFGLSTKENFSLSLLMNSASYILFIFLYTPFLISIITLLSRNFSI
ncbi:MAG: hypothetical protein WC435_01590 [Candidatus Paceibacterota bacterium]